MYVYTSSVLVRDQLIRISSFNLNMEEENYQRLLNNAPCTYTYVHKNESFYSCREPLPLNEAKLAVSSSNVSTYSCFTHTNAHAFLSTRMPSSIGFAEFD